MGISTTIDFDSRRPYKAGDNVTGAWTVEITGGKPVPINCITIYLYGEAYVKWEEYIVNKTKKFINREYYTKMDKCESLISFDILNFMYNS